MEAVKKSSYRRLDFSKICFSDTKVKMEEALKDVTPIQWSDEVLSGKREVIISKTNAGE